MTDICYNKIFHRIGITGGVGSGKSTVLAILRDQYGAEIIEADAVARALMEPGGASYQAVVSRFGTGILQPDGRIDRNALAALVFAEPALREELNQMTHPLVKQEVEVRMNRSQAPLVVYEAALPEEAKMRELCQEIWYIHVPEEIREERLMASRGYSREKCRQIMAAQLSEEAFRKLSDRIIENGGTVEETAAQLKKILTI